MKANRNRVIHHMLVIDGKSLAAAAAYGISRMRCQQIACTVAKTRALTEARECPGTREGVGVVHRQAVAGCGVRDPDFLLVYNKNAERQTALPGLCR